MKKNLSHSIPLLALCLFATSCMGVVRTVRVTVTEEDGAPIKDADVAVKYLGYQKTTRKEGQSNKISKAHGVRWPEHFHLVLFT